MSIRPSAAAQRNVKSNDSISTVRHAAALFPESFATIANQETNASMPARMLSARIFSTLKPMVLYQRPCAVIATGRFQYVYSRIPVNSAFSQEPVGCRLGVPKLPVLAQFAGAEAIHPSSTQGVFLAAKLNAIAR